MTYPLFEAGFSWTSVTDIRLIKCDLVIVHRTGSLGLNTILKHLPHAWISHQMWPFPSKLTQLPVEAVAHLPPRLRPHGSQEVGGAAVPILQLCTLRLQEER